MIKNIRILIIGLAILFTAIYDSHAIGDIIPDPLNYQQMPFDVLHYDLKLDLRQYNKREVIGTCKILVHRKDIYDGDYFIFHLQSLKVNGVTAQGKEMSYSAYLDEKSKDFHYRVNYPDNISDTVEFTISYSGIMTAEVNGNFSWGGAFYEEGILYSMGVGFGAPYISTSRHWMPCFDLPQDKATFKGSFTVPYNLKVASNGTLTAVNDVTDGVKEFVWEHNYPAATYLLNFAAGKYQLLDYKDYKVPIQIFSLEIDSAKSNFVYSRLPEMADCYSNIFGDYPFEKIGYCNTTKGAMEHQTMISFPRSLVVDLNTKKNSNNITAAHELSHQWFGNMVTPLDFRDAWLNESFATYCEALWERCRNGDSAYHKHQITHKDDYINKISKAEGIFPLYNFPREKPSSNYPTTIYSKGAVVLGMLNYNLQFSGFDLLDIIKNYLKKYAYSNVSTKDFTDFVKSQTLQDYDWFFEQWVYSAGWPQIIVEFADRQNGKYSSKLKIKQVQSGKLFTSVPVEILYYSNGGSFTSVNYISDEETNFDLGLEHNFKIDSIKVNPGNIVVGLYEFKKIQVTTSIDESETQPFEIFQTENQITLNYQSNTGKSNVIIFDLFGNVIYKEEISSNLGMNSFKFNFNNYSSSVYFMQFTIDNKLYTQKISVIH
jgi:aminopeptidase N